MLIAKKRILIAFGTLGVATSTFAYLSSKKLGEKVVNRSIRNNSTLQKYLKKGTNEKEIDNDKVLKFESFFNNIDDGSKIPRKKENLSFISNI